MSETSNINFKSNIYVVLVDRPDKVAELDSFIKDYEFLNQIYDPVKIKKIKNFNERLLSKQQLNILDKFLVCNYYPGRAKYHILRKKRTASGKIVIEDVCKCRLLDCPMMNKECRPNQREQIIKEEEEFSKLNIATDIDKSTYYPVMNNFERIIERYKYKAYRLVANTDLQKYIDAKNKNITFLYSGQGNGGNWDNWDGGDINNYFDSSTKKSPITPVKITTMEKSLPENPLLEYQKKNPKNLSNPFFSKNKNHNN